MVFKREGCALCHTPPQFTNNKLTLAEGFSPPEDHSTRYDILRTSVGTDSNLALRTRRGTGYYKVPSLKGVWYRGPFEHNGSWQHSKTGLTRAVCMMTTCRPDGRVMA